MDDQYWNELKQDPDAMQWLNDFNEEYVNASFRKNKKHIHKTKSMKRDSYNRNNARNRCIYTREKAQGKLNYVEDLKIEMNDEYIEYEDRLIEEIDNSKKLLNDKFDSLKKRDDGNDSTNEG